MKWLNDKNSVSQEELEENRRKVYNTDAATYAAYTAAAAYAAYATYAADAADAAAYWVDIYFKRTGEDKQDYINYLNRNWLQRLIDRLLFPSL